MFNKIYSRVKSLTKGSQKKNNPERISGNKPDQTRLDELMPIGSFMLLLYHLKEKGVKGRQILDVGSHSTEWIREAKKVFPDAISYLIEPLSEMEIHLKKFCDENPGSKYFLKGAGSESGKLWLTVWNILEGANFLQPEIDSLKSKDQQREIEIITVDSLIEKNEIEIPEIVKLDIQGFELEALKGATKLFGKTEVFILEVSFFEFVKGVPLFSEVIQFMAERGYEVYDFPGFSRRPYDGALGQIDICFVKKNGFLRQTNKWFKDVNNDR